MKRTYWWLLLVAVAGCGDDAPQTEFGSLKSVERYRDELEAIIVEVNAIEQEVWERAVGSTGRATGQNLAPVYRELKPRLVALIVDLDEIAVPPKLTEMHGEMRSALGLRLEAFDLVITGWATEQQGEQQDREQAGRVGHEGGAYGLGTTAASDSPERACADGAIKH